MLIKVISAIINRYANFFMQGLDIRVHPLTPERWSHFETLLGPKGACGGCWCMWWRLKRSDWEKQKGEGNKAAMKTMVWSRQIPGILAYQRGEPVAWCSIAAREDFPLIERSRVLKPIDDKPVWSITCLFIAKSRRRKGLTLELLDAAVEYAQKSGAKIVEGYPIDTDKANYPVVFAGTGFYPTFKKAGFKECGRRSTTRPIMRYTIEERSI